jgi:hypothetical protein
VVKLKSGRLSLGRKPLRYQLYRKLCGPQWRFVLCGEEENILHFPEIEPRIVQPVVWLLNLLRGSGLPVLPGCWSAADAATATFSEPATSLTRDANGSPEPGPCCSFYLFSSWDSPPPPQLPYQLMLSFLISHNYFTSSFPSFLLSLILKSGKPYPLETTRVAPG